VCISDSVSLGPSHYCCQEFNLHCLYFTLLLVHVHISTPYNSILLQYFLYVVVLHFVSLS
jgi:hypothetical protein